ncbi:hypothetical protein BDF20DRAFT_885489 [Mycotypha africana]|uniref:uncharacterized protein n=1 Tax=Mycotypha africana TaxID=64632 RepID=UPI0023003121|nr:uncharacterized protein BDF20DRAFT_885489 [Mycotypha africana]KAI8971635.1 hypothetical protein BDF20DRAFT_885489 [Mycotypha africana]
MPRFSKTFAKSFSIMFYFLGRGIFYIFLSLVAIEFDFDTVISNCINYCSRSCLCPTTFRSKEPRA